MPELSLDGQQPLPAPAMGASARVAPARVCGRAQVPRHLWQSWRYTTVGSGHATQASRGLLQAESR